MYSNTYNNYTLYLLTVATTLVVKPAFYKPLVNFPEIFRVLILLNLKIINRNNEQVLR